MSKYRHFGGLHSSRVAVSHTRISGRRFLQVPFLSKDTPHLTVSPAMPYAASTDPTGPTFSASFDAISGDVTVMYMNEVVVIKSATFNLDGMPVFNTFVEDGSLSMYLGSELFLQTSDFFSSSGGRSAAQVPTAYLLGIPRDGSSSFMLDPSVSVVLHPAIGSSVSRLVVTGPGSQV